MTSLVRTLLFILSASLIVVSTRYAHAEYDVRSKTYIKFYDDARDNKYTPLYEYLELESRDAVKGLWDVYLSGWWGHDFKTLQYGSKNRDELTNAYIKLSPMADGRFVVGAGRQPIVDGVVAQRIDGVSARWEPSPSFGFTMFGGVPVENVFDTEGSASSYGGRIYQRIARKMEVGLSYMTENIGKTRVREDAGLDIWLSPAARVEAKGHSLYNKMTEGWGEHSYTVRYFPLNKMTLTGSFSHTSYTDLFSAGSLTVFSADFLGKNETLTKKGGLIEYRIGDSTTGIIDYGEYSYRIMGDAAYYGVKMLSMLYGLSSGLSLHWMAGDIDKLRYLESRAFAAKDVENWRFTMDAINRHYAFPISGMNDAYSVTGTVRWSITESLSSTCSIDYAKTPDFAYASTALLSLIYNFSGGK